MTDAHFLLDPYIFPLFAVTQDSEGVKVGRFIGTGFWLDSDGHFMTCKHVLESLAPGQLPAIGQPFGEKRDYFVPVLSSVAHANYDIAVGTAPKSAVKGVLARYKGAFGIGLDVLRPLVLPTPVVGTVSMRLTFVFFAATSHGSPPIRLVFHHLH